LVNVTNHGPAAAANVVVTDTIAITNGSTDRVDSVDGNWTPSGQVPGSANQVIVANLGTVQPSATAQQLRFTVFIRRIPGAPLSVTDTVTVSSATTDSTLGNNTATTANTWPD
jgi:hypothetical protein